MPGKISKQTTVTQVMLHVLLAVLPLTVAQILFFGWGVLINILVICAVALATEVACLAIARKNIPDALADLSALVGGVLLALCLPPQLPPAELALGAVFMIVIGKHIYGGLGNNPFNPAMLAYAMLLLSFPVAMTSWLEPKLLIYLNDLTLLRLKLIGDATAPDGMTGATALDAYRGVFQQEAKPVFGTWWSSGDASAHSSAHSPAHSPAHSLPAFLLMNLMSVLGGAWLLWKRIITWHIPLALLAGLLLPSLVFDLSGGPAFPPVWFHLVFGAGLYGAFFIATDPVSAATGYRARLIYGFGIGIMTYIIRTWGGYADAIAFAILFFNVAAPFIDKYTRPLPTGYRATARQSDKK